MLCMSDLCSNAPAGFVFVCLCSYLSISSLKLLAWNKERLLTCRISCCNNPRRFLQTVPNLQIRGALFDTTVGPSPLLFSFTFCFQTNVEKMKMLGPVPPNSLNTLKSGTEYRDFGGTCIICVWADRMVKQKMIVYMCDIRHQQVLCVQDPKMFVSVVHQRQISFLVSNSDLGISEQFRADIFNVRSCHCCFS